MKNINEMTEQEILALTEEDVQKMIKFRMMEEGIKIMDSHEFPNCLRLSLLIWKFSPFRSFPDLPLQIWKRQMRLQKH